MTDICLTPFNIQHTVENVVDNVKIISNKKRKTKKAEYYLKIGGGYDTESTTIMSGEKPSFAFVYHVQIMINSQYIYFREIDLIVPFFMQLIEVIKRRYHTEKVKPKLIMWVANLAHEWAFAKRQFELIGITNVFAKSERNPLKIELENTIEFRECIGLFGRSLANIAETYTKTQKLKGDLDYNLIRTPTKTKLTETEYNYCKNDVQILDELSHIAFKKFTEKGLKIPLTSTGILRQECKAAAKNLFFEYTANELLMPKTEKDYFMFRKYLYNGGLCGSNIMYINQTLKGVKCADITSDYPAQINHELYPAGELIEDNPEKVVKLKSKFRIYHLYIESMQAKTKHCVFSRYKIINNDFENAIFNNGKIYKVKNVEIMVNNVDIKALTKVYDFQGVKILKSWYFTQKSKSPKFVRDIMNEYYLKKNELKEQGKSDTIEYKEAKAFVNSFYGMFATSIYSDVCEWNENAHDIKAHTNQKTYDEQRRRMWLNPFIAYWCTSYARKILIDVIAEFSELIVQYDTDSIYYITDPEIVKPERVKELEIYIHRYNLRKELVNEAIFAGNKHFQSLGTWDIENETYLNFKCLGSKRYILQHENGNIKPVVAGLPKKAFLKYIKDNNLNPFNEFHMDMKINSISSGKLASVYYDGISKDYYITDYQGNGEIVKVGTYHALFNIEFTMKDISNLLYLKERLHDEQTIPPEYRKININESEVIINEMCND